MLVLLVLLLVARTTPGCPQERRAVRHCRRLPLHPKSNKEGRARATQSMSTPPPPPPADARTSRRIARPKREGAPHVHIRGVRLHEGRKRAARLPADGRRDAVRQALREPDDVVHVQRRRCNRRSPPPSPPSQSGIVSGEGRKRCCCCTAKMRTWHGVKRTQQLPCVSNRTRELL